jgi:peptidoglycan biosynthesis protein MviN/MurJ (putative lipid II flippase)
VAASDRGNTVGGRPFNRALASLETACENLSRASRIGSVALYIGGLLGCALAFVLFRRELCPISAATYYLAHASLGAVAMGIVAAVASTWINRTIGAWLALGGGVVLFFGLFVATAVVGSACGVCEAG